MKFLFILLIEIVLTIFVVVGMVAVHKKIRKKELSKVYYIFLALAFISLIYYIPIRIVPKVRDIPYFISGNYKEAKGTCDRLKKFSKEKEVTFKGEDTNLEQWTVYPEAGKEYKIKFLPNSKWIVDCQ